MHNVIAPDEGFQLNTTPTAPGAATKSMNLRELWAAIFRSRLWIAAIMALCIVGALVFTLLSTRLYESSASIEVRQEAEKVLGTEADRESVSSKIDTDRFLETQLDILRSRSVANAVAEDLGLYRGTGFLEAMRVEEDPEFSEILSPQEMKREQVLEVIADNLSVDYTGETRIASITFQSPDPRLAARVANGFADNFIRNNLARKFDSSSYALDFLRDQLTEAQARLEQSEQEAVNYARRTRIVDARNAATGETQGGPASLTTAQLVQLNQAYSTAVAERIAAEQKWRRTASLPLLTIPEVLANQAIQALLDRRAQAEATYEQQAANRREDYPGVQEAAAQRTEMNQQVQTLAQSIRNSIRSQYDVALAQERRLSGQLDQLKTATLSEQNQSIQLSILRRGAETNRLQYDALLRRFNELNAESGVQTNNLSIVDPAQVASRPTWPKLPLNIALAIVAGMVLSIAFVILREQLFDAVRTPDDIVDRLSTRLLGAIPSSDDIATALRDQKSPLSEAFNSVRTSLSLITGEGAPKSMMFTSVQASEGKSTACHSLALAFARLGKRVVIVDVDLRRPNAHRLFEMQNRLGLSDVMSNRVELTKAVAQTPIPNIDILTAGDVPPNPTELIQSPILTAIIADLEKRYDVLLVDSAPVLGLADAVILANVVEATVFVIEAGRNTIRATLGAMERITRSGGTIAGAVLMKFDPGRLGYGYGSDYGYSYRYDYSSRKE